MEPLLKGPAGLDYLKRAFANHFGPPADALTSLPLTMQWILSIWDSKDQEWDEHTNALLELIRRQKSSSQSLHPSTTLRTGGIISVNTSGSQMNPFAANPAAGLIHILEFEVYSGTEAHGAQGGPRPPLEF